MTKKIDLSNVTRLEIINHSSKGQFGRVFTYWSKYGNGVNKPIISLDLQDEGRTLKVFIDGDD